MIPTRKEGQMGSAMDKIRDPDAPGWRQEATSHLPTDDALDVTLFGVVSEQDIIVERDRLNTEKQEYEQYDFTDAEQLRERHLEDERYWDCWTVEILDLCLLEWSGPDECEWYTQEFFRRRIHAEYGLEYGWFEHGANEEVDRLLIHEFGHQYSGDHLSEEYHEALCRLGAGLKRLALKKPESVKQFIKTEN